MRHNHISLLLLALAITASNAGCGDDTTPADAGDSGADGGDAMTDSGLDGGGDATVDGGTDAGDAGDSGVATAATTRIDLAPDGSEGTGPIVAFGSSAPSISLDGRYVAYKSHHSNLVAGDTNDADDVFVYDRVEGTNRRVSVATDGSQGNGASDSPHISADGAFVVFRSLATNFVLGDTNVSSDIFRYNLATGAIELVSAAFAGGVANDDSFTPKTSSDGALVVFSSSATDFLTGGNNDVESVFVRDMTTGTTEQVSLTTSGSENLHPAITPTISADGNLVAFACSDSLAPPESEVFFGMKHQIYVRGLGPTPTINTTLMSTSMGLGNTWSNGTCDFPSLSEDGALLTFDCTSSDIVASDTNGSPDVFLAHVDGSVGVARVSLDNGGVQLAGPSQQAQLSADGSHVLFESSAPGVTPTPIGGVIQMYVREVATGTNELVSASSDGTPANNLVEDGAFGLDGAVVAFATASNNIVADDTNQRLDLFVRVAD